MPPAPKQQVNVQHVTIIELRHVHTLPALQTVNFRSKQCVMVSLLVLWQFMKDEVDFDDSGDSVDFLSCSAGFNLIVAAMHLGNHFKTMRLQ